MIDTSPKPTTQLALKRVAIDTYHEHVAYLNRRCAAYRAEGFQALSKVVITMDGKSVVAVLNIVDDDSLVSPDEIGLSEQSYRDFSQPEGTPVFLSHAEPPASMHHVRGKMSGQILNREQIHSIVDDIVNNRYSKPEIAAFLVSSAEMGLERDEVLHLTEAMIKSGHTLKWSEETVVDKHCIGGIPGNRTSMVVIPIVAAYGLLFPKTSSRAITSPAGTADTMEVFATVDVNPEEMHRIVNKHRACLAWGGKARLAPVDDILISVERPLEIDSPGQMVASILAKKVACGSSHLLIDIPTGPQAKVSNTREAVRLRKIFEYVADHLGIHLQVVITDGSQPIGNGIGPILEARDVMQVLQNAPQAPQDLREKSLQLAGMIIEFDPNVRGGDGYRIAKEILDDGRALQKFNDIIDAQGRQPAASMAGGPLQTTICASRDGTISSINNLIVARIARLAGAPMDKSAGVDIFRKIGDTVKKGDPLYRIHAEFQSDFTFACRFAHEHSGYVISTEEDCKQ